jgi:hypothetical protein
VLACVLCLLGGVFGLLVVALYVLWYTRWYRPRRHIAEHAATPVVAPSTRPRPWWRTLASSWGQRQSLQQRRPPANRRLS